MASNADIFSTIDPDAVLAKALKAGASYADIRFHQSTTENIRVENKNLEGYSSRTFSGVGIRAVVKGAVGFASTSDLEKASVMETALVAVKAAKAFESKRGFFAEAKTQTLEEIVKAKENPVNVSPEEKVKLLLEANKASYINEEIKSSITIFGCAHDYRYFQSSDGTKTTIEVPTIGVVQISIATHEGKMEQFYNQIGDVGGFELIRKENLNDFTVDISERAITTVKAKSPPSGTYPVVVDPQLVGILTHEAFGHAAEADLVFTGTSTLKDRLGVQLASEQVTIIDEGMTKGGYPVPFDDEGVRKGKTVILDKGVLKGYMHDRNTAKELAVEPSGNSRAQDFENQPQVRMTNTYIDAGNYKFEELLEGIKEGIYMKRKGSGGGQVEVGMGTFTFNAGESRMIRKGELAEYVRGVVISGAILENLKTVDAVGKDLRIDTGHFGACGKGGQRAKVGFGGPHIRVQKMTVGGK